MKDFLSTSSDAWKLPPVIRYKETKDIVEIEEGEEEEEEEEEGNEDGEEKGEIMESNLHKSSTDTDPVPQEPLYVCAIDCEMCYTKAGLELTRVRIVPLSAPSSFFILYSLFFFFQSIKFCILILLCIFHYPIFALSRSATFFHLLSFLDPRLNIFDAISDFCGVSSEGGRVRLLCSASIASGRLQHSLLRWLTYLLSSLFCFILSYFVLFCLVLLNLFKFSVQFSIV